MKNTIIELVLRGSDLSLTFRQAFIYIYKYIFFFYKKPDYKRSNYNLNYCIIYIIFSIMNSYENNLAIDIRMISKYFYNYLKVPISPILS